MANPNIELVIKSSAIDSHRKGGCLFCHEYFMELFLMAELQTITLKVTLVDMLKPPEDFRTKFGTTPPPILLDGNTCIVENEILRSISNRKFPEVITFLRNLKK